MYFGAKNFEVHVHKGFLKGHENINYEETMCKLEFFLQKNKFIFNSIFHDLFHVYTHTG